MREKAREAATLLAAGVPRVQVAKQLGINRRTIQRWSRLPEFQEALQAPVEDPGWREAFDREQEHSQAIDAARMKRHNSPPVKPPPPEPEPSRPPCKVWLGKAPRPGLPAGRQWQPGWEDCWTWRCEAAPTELHLPYNSEDDALAAAQMHSHE